ncbi:MAG TPA: hypothetical protein VGQ55_06610 [Pyrinomonadaceae bacterium]|nr:hypothetical protein [Pyrinomonadaceae bacterium]
MKSSAANDHCPKCGSLRLKTWDELTDEEQFLAERLPASAHFKTRERKRHRFCTRCWFEETDISERRA